VVIVTGVGLLAFAAAATGPIAFVGFLAGPIAARIIGPVNFLLVPAGLVGAPCWCWRRAWSASGRSAPATWC
jgi:iron complex transport system permease protein